MAELTNDDRADLAVTAIERFAAIADLAAGPAIDEARLTAFLADLMHFADRHAVAFTAVLETATGTYAREAPDHATAQAAGEVTAPGTHPPAGHARTPRSLAGAGLTLAAAHGFPRVRVVLGHGSSSWLASSTSR